MAAFPDSIADDNDLIVADDRKSTTLLGAISSGITTIVVTSGVFSANSVVTIQNERILLGESVVPGTYTGCTRGYDDSTAASHASGILVSANVVAAHHNVLREEVQAIEAALGANLSFVQKAFNSAGFVWSFSGVTNLTGSTPASVVIPNTPGILAASANSAYIYITDGGSSEAVLLTSVSVGASNTTLGFTSANSHTAGQWTLGSASAGIQEAIKYAESQAGGGSVQIPRGTSATSAPIEINGSIPIDLFGSEQGSVLLPEEGNCIVCTATSHKYTLRNFTIGYPLRDPGPDTAGIYLANGTSGTPVIDGVTVAQGNFGFFVSDVAALSVRNCHAASCTNEGFYFEDCTDLVISSGNFAYNNDQGATTRAGMKIDGGTRVLCVGNSSTNLSGSSSQEYGLALAGDIYYLTITGNHLSGTTQGLYDNATTRDNWVIGENGGVTNQNSTLTAAASVTLPTSKAKVCVISGTTTINTINGFYGTGHEVIFVCPNSLTFSAAGNIAVAVTTTFANQIVRAVYNDVTSKWLLYA